MKAKKPAKRKPAKKSQQLHKQALKTKEIKFFPVAGKVRIVVTVLVIVCVAIVFADLFATKYCTPDKVAARKLEAMARDYYENYYYDKFVASIPADTTLEEAMSNYTSGGFAKVYLRHLLLHDNEKNQGNERYFDTVSYICDKNETAIKIIPIEPFGKKDYTITYNFACNYK